MDVQRMTRFRQEAALYESHQVELTRFATALVGPSDAADVVSEAVSSLLRSGKLEEADRPEALMYRAVLAKARSHQRSFYRRRARERRFADELISHDPELRPDVVDAVMRLSPRQKACVYLTYWEDLSPSGVAERLGIGEGTVKGYLARARARLREVLDE
ncbi:MAG: sigma-70 family RNA polymerase sigma factor [Actinomycetota bacterium]|nr:sigma-70 family RNA polymerase sigma factor [Actinomycetota bacterium]